MSVPTGWAAFCSGVLSCLLGLVAAADEPWSDQDGLGFIATYCVDCHQPPKPKGGLDLSGQTSREHWVGHALEWEKHLPRVRDNEMPPDDEGVPQPSAEERLSFLQWAQDTLRTAACEDGIQPGPPILRRLNRSEYSASVRHLLDVHFDAGEALPEDGAGGEGFDNASETLFISPIHAEKYLDAARSAVAYAFADTRSSKRFMVAEPGEDLSEESAASRILGRFLSSAFRRPVEPAERDTYLDLFRAARLSEQDFHSALQTTLAAAMVSPKFLFLIEAPVESGQVAPVSQEEMASRLSYFLWGAPPDDTLMQLAQSQSLHDPEILAAQVKRMLGKDHERKVRNVAQQFVEQWLGTRALGREFKPDASIEGYDSELEGGMKYEPVFFFQEILSEDRPLTDLIDADYTYINRRLSRHYKVKGEFREQPKRVEIAENPHRGGLLSMAAILAVSSHPHRTSPVLRGKWILETLLGEPPPPPPPDVPELEENSDAKEPASLRERLEAHRQDPSCNACHERMDPLGFSLENYDVLGRWRDQQDGQPIDVTGSLPDGTRFEGPQALKALLMDRKEQVMRHLTRKMLGYALGRGLSPEDYCAAESILSDLREHGYSSHRLLIGIVQSVPFRYKIGPETPSDL